MNGNQDVVNTVFLSVYLILDSKVSTTERRTFTVIDSFSVIGGFIGLLFLLVTFFTKRI
jgi:hypothetical protein